MKNPMAVPRSSRGTYSLTMTAVIVEIKVQDTPWIILAGTAKAELSMLSEYMNTARVRAPTAAM